MALAMGQPVRDVLWLHENDSDLFDALADVAFERSAGASDADGQEPESFQERRERTRAERIARLGR